MANSLSPFLIVFDNAGRPVAAGARLQGATPTPPAGVFTSARSGEVRQTWQPATGVRAAMVVVHYPGGFVLAARSLREVERREDNALALAIVGMIAALALAALAAAGTAVATDIIAARQTLPLSSDQ
jgi:hypothetical protein